MHNTGQRSLIVNRAMITWELMYTMCYSNMFFAGYTYQWCWAIECHHTYINNTYQTCPTLHIRSVRVTDAWAISWAATKPGVRTDTIKHHALLISVIHLRVSSVFLVSGARTPVCWCIRTTSPLLRWLSETRGAPDPRPSLPWDRCAARGTVSEGHLILNSGPGRVPRMTYTSIIFVCWCHGSCLRFVCRCAFK